MALTLEERNLKMVKDGMNLAGFGGKYDKVVDAGIAAHLPEIIFDPARKEYKDGPLMVWEPKVKEGKTQGLYNFNGFQATLLVDNKVIDRQFIYNSMTKGMTLENSYTALNGGTVLHSDWDNDNKRARMVFTRFDLDPNRITPKGQHPIVRVDASRVNMSALMGKESIVGNGVMIDKYLAELQTGNPVYVQVREKVEGVDQQNYYWLLLNLKTTQEMTMEVINAKTGELAREWVEPAQQRQMAKTEGLEVVTDKALSEGVLKALNAPGAEVGGDNVRPMMSPDQLLRKFNASKKEGGAGIGDVSQEGDEKKKKDGVVPDNVKTLLDETKDKGKGKGAGTKKTAA